MKDKKSSKSRSLTATTNKRYSDRQKIEAVTTYLMLGGNVIMTSATTKIPEVTLYTWKKSEWWNTLVNDIKQEERLVLSTRLKKVVEKSWEVVGDRLEHGDWMLNQKTGELVRKPVSMKDAAKVANDSVILREKLDMNESFTVHADQIEDKLAKLAKAFSDLAKGVVAKEEPEDVEYVEVVDDKSGISEGMETEEPGEDESLSEGMER